jgi:hypothetical protein
VLLIGHRLWVADEFNGQAPWRACVDEPIAFSGLRSWQWVRAGHEIHSVAAQVFRCGVQVVDVDCQVLYPDVARPRELLALVG